MQQVNIVSIRDLERGSSIDKIMIAWSLLWEDRAGPASHGANVTNARNVNTQHYAHIAMLPIYLLMFSEL